MALRAGYFGLKRFERNKLFNLIASTPADISPNNPIAGKNDVLTSIGLLDETVGWLGIQQLKHPYDGVADGVEFTNEGITYITNADNYSILVKSGTSTAYSERALFARSFKTFKLEAGIKYILKGGNEKIALTIGTGSGDDGTTGSYVIIARSRGNAVEFTAPDKWLTVSVQVIEAGVTISEDTVIYPILYKVDDYYLYPDYVPYHASVAELITPKLLTSTNDLDNIKTGGDYYWTQSYPAHSPENNTFGGLRVIPCGEVVYQMVIRGAASSASIYIRRFQETWSNWFKFSGTEVTPASLTKEDATKKATKKKVIKEEEE